MSVSYAPGLSAFYNVDSLVDFLVSLGMRPIFELSFMPDWLTSGNNTVCHYKGNSDPPRDYALWGNLIGELGRHLVGKYGEQLAGEFFFEVWNLSFLKTCTGVLPLTCNANPLFAPSSRKVSCICLTSRTWAKRARTSFLPSAVVAGCTTLTVIFSLKML